MKNGPNFWFFYRACLFACFDTLPTGFDISVVSGRHSLSYPDREPSIDCFGVCLKLGCFQSTGRYSALEVSHFMRYINRRLSLLTRLFTGFKIIVVRV